MRALAKAPAIAAAAMFCLMAMAHADILTVFDVSGTLNGSPNANPATYSGSFTLDQTTGTLAAIDLSTPVGAFTGSNLDFITSSFVQTTSNGAAFQIATYTGGGTVGFGLAFAGTVDGFTGGDVLTQASHLGVLVNPSTLACNSSYAGCNGSPDSFEVTSGLATTAVAATVPEPGSLALFGPALAGLGLALRASRNGVQKSRKSRRT